jgi:septal ring factor EnvC (AmiA/AmiB activator)
MDTSMDSPGSPQTNGELVDALRQLVLISQQISQSLANLERLYAEQVRRFEDQRKEFAERQKGWDERQKRWDERQKRWDEQRPAMASASSGTKWQTHTFVLLLAILLLAPNGFSGSER